MNEKTTSLKQLWFLIHTLSRKDRSSFGATTRQNFAAIGGRHAGTETVDRLVFALAWLICTFHLKSLRCVLHA